MGDARSGPKGVLMVQVGARMHYAVPEMLLRHGILERFETDIIQRQTRLDPVFLALTLLGQHKRFAGRRTTPGLEALTQEQRGMALGYLAKLRRAKTQAARRHLFLDQAQKFSETVARRGFGGADTVYCQTTCAQNVFEAAGKQNVHRILEQYIAAQPVRDDILADAFARYANWQPAAEAPAEPPALYDRVRREWDLADQIVCPSQFVADSLTAEGVPAQKISIAAYGVSMPDPAVPHAAATEKARPLRVLFVGSVEIRKGIHTLCAALERLPENVCEARVAGVVRLSEHGTARLSSVADILGIVPRTEIGKQFDWADVLVLPSLVEGSATVTYEALVRGVPVICTPNSGSIVRDGQTGHIVPTDDPDALAEILAALHSNTSRRIELQSNAWQLRHEASFEAYEDRLMAAIGVPSSTDGA